MCWPILNPTFYIWCSWHYGESWSFVDVPMAATEPDNVLQSSKGSVKHHRRISPVVESISTVWVTSIWPRANKPWHQSSIVWKLYNQQIYSPVLRLVTGIPASWDSCIASARTTEKVHCTVWSPCGQFIVAGVGVNIEVRDSNTLERVSVLKPSVSLLGATPEFLAFSPNGCLLACSYFQ